MKIQNDILNTLFQEIDLMKQLKKISKSDKIHEAIDRLVEVTNALYQNRDPLHGALRETYNQVEISTLPTCNHGLCTGPIVDSQTSQDTIPTTKKTEPSNGQQDIPEADAMSTIQKRLNRQDMKLIRQEEKLDQIITNIALLPTTIRTNNGKTQNTNINTEKNLTPQEEMWHEVRKRKKPENKTIQTTPLNLKTSIRTKTRLKAPLPDAIAVKPGNGETFADILKIVRTKVNLETIGVTVTAITEVAMGSCS